MNFQTKNSIAYATWQGQWKDGAGTISTQSGVIDAVPYSFASRFEEPAGAGPEELLAASHASCLNQAIANVLAQAGFTTTQVKTRVEIILGRDENEKLQIQGSKIKLEAQVPGVTEEIFQASAEKAKNGCTISRVLSCPIEMTAVLL
jgi:osmotically inducible protein OsmC